jgi:Protein of unknown function (DUF1553)/Protein of unknown function (DUF1549)
VSGSRTLGCALAIIACARAEPPLDAHKHWAFQPPREVALPAVIKAAWPVTGVDFFVLAKLEEAKVAPPVPADPRTLIRRMAFDITGLPPTHEEAEAFAREYAGDSRAAVAALADRLLASPRYGEKWGRHWLDIARFSDTKGYVYGREERRFVHAPAYRDWVIRAFNEDMPYDRFLQLQLAADQLVPSGSPDLAAMGFVTGGRRFLGVTHDIIDDRIDVITRGTLALTVSCARCHDHKFDPISIEDYYSLYGVFRGGDDRLAALAPLPDDKELATKRSNLSGKLAQRRGEENSRLRARVGDYLAAQLEMKNYPEEGFDQLLSAGDVIPFSVRRWRDFLHATKSPPNPIFAPWHVLVELKNVPEPEFEAAAAKALAPVLADGKLNAIIKAEFSKPVPSLREAAARYGRVFNAVDEEWKAMVADATRTKVPPPARMRDDSGEQLRQFLHDPRSPTVVPDTGMVNTEFFFPTTVCEELWKLEGEVDRRLIALGVPHALILSDRSEQTNPRVFKRGSPSRLGDEVPRQFLEILSRPRAVPFKNGSGRLELARAIATPENPLTARVMVNRIWQHHFGEGLVKTPSDFGLRSEPPSNPDLLDWLARRFIADGWSVKKMHRLIVTSAAYSVAADVNPRADQSARTLTSAATRRLDFEQLRDAMLAVTGELDPTMGGMPAGVLDAGNKRRTVYSFVDRQFMPGVLRTFDFANPDIHVATRHETTVPQQALFFLNGPFAADRAKALAARFAPAAPEQRVQLMYRALFQRDATAKETGSALKFIAAAGTGIAAEPEKPRETPWRYGVGEYDEATKRVKNFTPLAHFTGTAWQGAAQFPGGATAWAQLTAEGGHPGNIRAHAVVRRWVAPGDATVSITGTLNHEPGEGDGIRAFIISSRHGLLKSTTLHHAKAEMAAAIVEVKAGDTLDFVADIGGTLAYDQFLWSPVVTAAGAKWDAGKDFTGPAPAMNTLAPWEQFAQVLLLSNEFAFVD